MGVERMYKTGDLGRLLCNGTLEYLGRKDRQAGHASTVNSLQVPFC